MHYIGLDLGQRADHAAAAIAERLTPSTRSFDYVRWTPVTESHPDQWVVRRLERAPLGVPYTQIVDWVRGLALLPALRQNARLVVDATGVGLPVVDMLREAALPCEIMPVVLTAGFEDHFDGRFWRAPKNDLLTRLQMLLEQRRLRFAQGLRDLDALTRELFDVRARERTRGHLRIGADAPGQHDDLVMAVALSVWMGRHPQSPQIGPQPHRLL